MAALILFAVGAVSLVAGVAVVYWPAALIVGGAGLIFAALNVDFEAFGRGPHEAP